MGFVLVPILLASGFITSPAFAYTNPYQTVIFSENDSPSDAVYVMQTENVSTALYSFSSLSPSFVNDGEVFVDWNTQPDGSGTSYSDGEMFDFGTGPDTDLYAIWSVGYRTVTFAENDSGTDAASASQTEDVPTALDSFSSLSPSFVNNGAVFVDWNTEPDGSGTSYSDADVFNFSSDTILYAIWSSPDAVTAVFDSGSGAGSVPSITADVGDTVELPSGAGFSNPGYSFAGWNTALNGSGTQYAASASVVLNSNETFYAQWSSAQYVITVVPDGGSVNSTTLDFSPGGNPIILPTPTYSTEYFSGWYTSPSGGTLIGLAGAGYVPSGSATIYAQWSSSPAIQITFADNGGSGLIVALSGDPGSVVALPGLSSLSMPGYTLSSWNTDADGAGTSYSLAQVVTLSTPLTLYAQWAAGSGANLVISFEMNGGSGSITTLTGAAGSTFKLPGSSTLLKVGYTLASWNTSANGKGVSYALGQSVALSASITLYAQWKKVSSQVLYGAIGLFTKNSAKLSTGLKDEIARLATTVKAKKYTKVTLYGYGVDTSNAALDSSLSKTRAVNVANYLRSELRVKKVSGVAISAAGEGAESRKSSASNSRVEVFAP
jgi:outer membrane protein OmpA-like peptidoglycan-associated protein